MDRLVVNCTHILPIFIVIAAGKEVCGMRRIEVDAQRHFNPWLVTTECRVVFVSRFVINDLKRLASIATGQFAVESLQQIFGAQEKPAKLLSPNLIERFQPRSQPSGCFATVVRHNSKVISANLPTEFDGRMTPQVVVNRNPLLA